MYFKACEIFTVIIAYSNKVIKFKFLSMAKKVTGKKVATIASKILKDKRYSQSVKSVAGSALSQKEKRKK